jgi:hypothetical protein
LIHPDKACSESHDVGPGRTVQHVQQLGSMHEQDDPLRRRVACPDFHIEKDLAGRRAERAGLTFDAQRAQRLEQPDAV